MIASLPMYLRPELVDAHDLFWALIKKYLDSCNIEAPALLSQPSNMQESWIDPTLILSQTCGMPYRNTLHGKVQLVGTPDFKVIGCDPGYYRSAIVVRRTDKRKNPLDYSNATFAFNSKDSQSGYASAFSFFTTHGFWFNNLHASGSHKASALAVINKDADVAALDAVTWRLLLKYESFTEQLRVLDWTDPTPGLPYITAIGNNRELIFDAISSAIEDLPSGARDLLGIHSLEKIVADDYLRVPNPP